MHCYYTCGANAAIADSSVTQSQRLVAEAIQHSVNYPAYYFRGIVIEDMVTVSFPPPPTQPNFRTEGTPPAKGSWPSGIYFGDGSGGVYAKYPSLRRCGVGIAKIEQSGDNIVFDLGIYLTLPGCIQTVPRSEAYALLAVLEHAANGASIEFFTDSKILSDTFAKGVPGADSSKNDNLHLDLHDHIKSKSLSMSVYWMPSHSEDDETKAAKKPDWCTDFHVKGNKQADRLAEVAARLAQILNDIALPVKK
jgi:Ribonuclease HI